MARALDIFRRTRLSYRSFSTANTELVRDFLDPAAFYRYLVEEKEVDFFVGVPDSLLKDFCGYVSDTAPESKHTITANEGSAVALATGYHMATGKVPLVYMQNSGLGNAVNPLLSLADPLVYGTPMLLVLGWRGEPGKKDEPQHKAQGQRMVSMLASMEIPFDTLPDFEEGAEVVIDALLERARAINGPVALCVKRQTFAPYTMKATLPIDASEDITLSREEALRLCIAGVGAWDAVVSTTGFASREVFELREELSHDHSRDFLTVGSMGHASAIALGIATGKPSRQVVCFDGDGAVLMQMGNLASVGMSGAANFKHVVNNNLVHDSVGAQPTGAEAIDIPAIAKACGYTWSASVSSPEEVSSKFAELLAHNEGPGLLEIRTKPGARSDLGRPTTTPIENKESFMKFLSE